MTVLGQARATTRHDSTVAHLNPHMPKTTHLTPLRLAALDMKTAAYFDEGAGRIIQPEQLK